jgi:hypothetical protein
MIHAVFGQCTSNLQACTSLLTVMFFISSQAVKAGGPNEETNKLLGDIIKESRMYNVPKDNIQVTHEAIC